MENINWKSLYLSFRLQNGHLVDINYIDKYIIDLAWIYKLSIPPFQIQIDLTEFKNELVKHRNSGGIYLTSASDKIYDKFCYWILENGPDNFTLHNYKYIHKALLENRHKRGIDNVLDIVYNTITDEIDVITRSFTCQEIYNIYTIKDLFNTQFIKYLLKK